MEERIKEIMAAVLEADVNEIKDTTAAGDLEKWDSLHHLNLIAAIEEEFNIQFEEEEMLELLNFQLITLAVKEKIS